MARVKILDGIVEGEHVTNKYGGTYYSFKGIPYAKPPIGDLRFKAPQPVEPWDGVREAKKFGPISYQYDLYMLKKVVGQEDCLYLNVYTPNVTPKKPLAVMVFIHGGAFISGSGDDDVYGPEFLVRKDVILVTFNYRLGVLGFLCLDTEEIPGNAGMKDQVAALQWVRNNIAQFGGDPNNVTLFGESAGSASVSYHLISPMSAGLFNRAILQSGSCTSRWAKCIKPRSRAISFAKKLGCKNTDDDKEVAKFFKALPIEPFIHVNLPITASEVFFSNINLYFAVVNEKKFGNSERFFYDDLLEPIKFHQNVDVIIGYMEHDGVVSFMTGVDATLDHANFYPEFFVPKPIAYRTTLAEQIEIGNRIKKFYFNNDEVSLKNVDELIKFFTADLFMYSSIVVARIVAATNRNKVYLYKFTGKSKRNIFTKHFEVDNISSKRNLVCHADDLAYLFPIKLLLDDVETNSREYRMIETVTAIWTNFAKFGCPRSDDSLAIKWLPFTKECQNYVIIDETVTPDTNPEKEEVLFWDTIYTKYFPQYTL